MLLGQGESQEIDDIGLANQVWNGLSVDAADSLANLIGRMHMVGPPVPKAVPRHARKTGKLSRQVSGRLYTVGRTVDVVARTHHGDKVAIVRFLEKKHRPLDRRTPLKMARAGSAGADAVINMLRRPEAGFAA